MYCDGMFSSKVDGPVPCAKSGIDDSQTRSRKWIVCENCSLWYHITCVKLTRQIEAIGGDAAVSLQAVMLPVVRKDVLPAIQKSFVIYEYKCHCDSRYVGRTSQRLQDRIKQYVPQWLRQQLTRPRRSQPHRSCKRNDTKPDCDSAIGQHLLDNDRCALNYDDKRFSILAAARSSFHLNLLEATYIKTRRPVLCRQKEFVYTLKLFR